MLNYNKKEYVPSCESAIAWIIVMVIAGVYIIIQCGI